MRFKYNFYESLKKRLRKDVFDIRRLFYPTMPKYATMEEWDEWYDNIEKKSKVKYFLVIELPSILTKLKNKISKPFIEIKYRFFLKGNIIDIGLPPGYYEIDTKMLYGLFNLLVYHVEYEKAMMFSIMEDKDKKSIIDKILYFLRIKHDKPNPSDGTKYLEWEMTLDQDPASPEYSPAQASAAREIYDLYDWWKNRRIKRSETATIYRYNANSYRLISDYMTTIDEERDLEDTEMLTRLIKIRKSLWI